MKLYDHQQKIIETDPKKTGLFLGTGSGKTRIALILAVKNTLVIAPKTQVEDKNWYRESDILEKSDFTLTVISKETFRRDWESLPYFDTIIIDECHTVLGVTPNTRQRNKKIIPKTSQLFEALQGYIAKNPPQRLYLLTATILRSPMTVWGAAELLGKQWDFYKFRSVFYIRLPMPGREVWIPKTDEATKERLAKAVKKLGFVGHLEDYFDVPDQVYKTVHIELTDTQKKRIKDMKIEYPEPIVRIGKIHQIENGVLAGDEFNNPEYFDNNKINAILDFALEFPRMIIFAKYRAQIESLKNELEKKGYNVLTLTGDTKDRGDVLKAANEMKECIVIVQAQISAGWELPQYPTMIFASRTYSYVDFIQAQGRIQRANNIKKNLYINLVVKGGVDEAVDKCLETKQDFSEHLYDVSHV